MVRTRPFFLGSALCVLSACHEPSSPVTPPAERPSDMAASPLPAPVSARVGEEAPRATPRPASVAETVAAIETCMHWPGEEPYDEERGQFLAAAIARDCPKAVALAKASYGALEADPAGALSLVILTTHFGAEYGAADLVPKADLPALCTTALVAVKRQLATDPDSDFPYFEQRCAALTGF